MDSPRRKSATPEEFVRVWQRSDSVSDVAEELGIARQTAAQRAYNFRRKGVPLKHMGSSRWHDQDWSDLADLARSLEQKK